MKHIRRILLLAVLAALVVGCAWGQTIKVSYQIVQTPAAMLSAPVEENIGVLVIVRTIDNDSIGKIEVQLDYYDLYNIEREVTQTVSRTQIRGNYNPSGIPILFVVPVKSVVAVYA